MRIQSLACLSLLLLAPGCEKHEPPVAATETRAATPKLAPPSVAQAVLVIRESPEFGDFHFTDAAVSIPVEGASRHGEQSLDAGALIQDGWLAGKADLELTDRARNDRRFIIRPNRVLDVVPLAKKELLEVVSVLDNHDGTVAVTFNWHWLPNEIGRAFPPRSLLGRRFRQPSYRAVATLQNDGHVWSVRKIAIPSGFAVLRRDRSRDLTRAGGGDRHRPGMRFGSGSQRADRAENEGLAPLLMRA
jgi:hypothetical protein